MRWESVILMQLRKDTAGWMAERAGSVLCSGDLGLCPLPATLQSCLCAGQSISTLVEVIVQSSGDNTVLCQH